MEVRLQKILSAAGVCSRRTAEEYISAGRVSVNGISAILGAKADPEHDLIALDGVQVITAEKTVWLMLNKPRGYVTTLSDERGRRTAADLVRDCGCRVWPVGRLDMDSEGLLLFTNDGAGTNLLIHPSHEIEKEYLVTVNGDIESALPVLNGSVELDGEILAPAKVEQLKKAGRDTILRFTIHQGKNRQVRRMCALAGLKVTRLQRVREGTLRLGDLPPGRWCCLSREEIDGLLKGKK